ncbi:MAG: hypothetical protein IKP29_06030 [Pseudobutyrivibrio sp.]|nr:hypothetical protein [Pseudobutyrivibrio sp.]
MRKLFRTFLLTAFAVLTVSATNLTVQAAEVVTETAQPAKVILNKAVIAKVFDAKYYAEKNPDVVAVLGDSEDVLLAHYMNNGIYEGRDASAVFNVSAYALANADLATLYGDNYEAYIEHYVNYGINEKRVASTAALEKLDPKTKAAVINASAEATKVNSGAAVVIMGGNSNSTMTGKEWINSMSTANWSPSMYEYAVALAGQKNGNMYNPYASRGVSDDDYIKYLESITLPGEITGHDGQVYSVYDKAYHNVGDRVYYSDSTGDHVTVYKSYGQETYTKTDNGYGQGNVDVVNTQNNAYCESMGLPTAF